MTAAALAPPRPASARPDRPGLTFPRVVRSEWVKFRSVRSTLWILPLTVVAMVGIAVLQAWGISQLDDPGFSLGTAEIVTGGWPFAQLAVAVLAVLVITGEYGTGMIRSSFAAEPRRVPVLVAKAVVLTAAVYLVALVAVALSWLATLPFLDEMGLELDPTDGATLRILLGAPLYLAAIGVLALAIGALVRHSAGALGTVLGLLLVVETVFASLPFRFFEVVSPFLPSTAGGRLLDPATSSMATVSDGPVLTPWQGYGVLVAWVVVLGTAALVLVRRRDA